VEAKAVLAISQSHILKNNFTAAAPQKCKSCSCSVLQDYIMTNLDKQLFHPTASNFQAPSVMTCQCFQTHWGLPWWCFILQGHNHLESSFFIITLSSQCFRITHSIALYAQFLYLRQNWVKFNCLTWDWFLSLVIH